MPGRKSRFMIGLFVVVGVMIGVAAVVWLGASQYFEEGTRYATYFDESVQGLQVGSRVKYRGVDVGKVEQIGVASDHKLVEVVIKIDLAGDIEKTVVTQLRSAGITGIVFVELDSRPPDASVLLPTDRIKAPYPVLPSRTSQTKQILKSIDMIMERIEQVDLRGISEQLGKTAHAMGNFLTSGRVPNITANLDKAAASLEKILARIDRILDRENVEGILEDARAGINEARQGIAETREGLDETRRGIAETRQLVSSLRQEIVNLKAGELAAKTSRLLDGVAHRTRVMGSDIETTTEEIRQAAESLRLLVDRLWAKPSDLLFSSSRNEEQKEKVDR